MNYMINLCRIFGHVWTWQGNVKRCMYCGRLEGGNGSE